MPAALDRLERRDRHALDPSARSSADRSAGITQLRAVGIEVLRGVVVELVALGHDLAARPRPPGRRCPARRTRSRARLDAALHHGLAGVPERLVHARRPSSPGRAPSRSRPMSPASPASRRPGSRAPRARGDALGVLEPFGLAHDLVRHHGQPGGGEQHLLHRLVHAHRRARGRRRPRTARRRARACPGRRRPRPSARAGPGTRRRSAPRLPSAADDARVLARSVASSTPCPPFASTSGMRPVSAGSAGGPAIRCQRPSRVMPDRDHVERARGRERRSPIEPRCS